MGVLAVTTAFLAVLGLAYGDIRGVRPEVEEQYYILRSTGTFKCFNSSKTIAFDRVNDDFCDCEDGSDEPGVKPGERSAARRAARRGSRTFGAGASAFRTAHGLHALRTDATRHAHSARPHAAARRAPSAGPRRPPLPDTGQGQNAAPGARGRAAAHNPAPLPARPPRLASLKAARPLPPALALHTHDPQARRHAAMGSFTAPTAATRRARSTAPLLTTASAVRARCAAARARCMHTRRLQLRARTRGARWHARGNCACAPPTPLAPCPPPRAAPCGLPSSPKRQAHQPQALAPPPRRLL